MLPAPSFEFWKEHKDKEGEEYYFFDVDADNPVGIDTSEILNIIPDLDVSEVKRYMTQVYIEKLFAVDTFAMYAAARTLEMFLDDVEFERVRDLIQYMLKTLNRAEFENWAMSILKGYLNAKVKNMNIDDIPDELVTKVKEMVMKLHGSDD